MFELCKMKMLDTKRAAAYVICLSHVSHMLGSACWYQVLSLLHVNMNITKWK